MDLEPQNLGKNHKRLIIAAIVFVAFCLIDTFNARYDKVLRNSFRDKFNNIEELETSLTSDSSQTDEIENAETRKKILSIIVVVIGLILLLIWVSLNLKHKFELLFFLFIYLAGMKFIDYELLYQWSLNSENMLIAKHVIVRAFPALLFLILAITTAFYKPLPKDPDWVLDLN